MPAYQVFKETALPSTREPHSIYLVAPTARPDFVEIYVTGASGTTVKRVIDQATVQSMIDAAVAAGSGGVSIVDSITERDAITAVNAQTVLVVDASADPTVTAGSATYVWRESNSSWIKISESESLDLVLSWDGITGRPTSATADIDDAVTKRHTHTNKTELDLIGQDTDGNFTYNGELPVIAWSSTGW